MEGSPWIFHAKCLPSDPRLMATVANGYLGTRVYGDFLHVNGVYNGSVGDCHRANVPSPVNVRIDGAKQEVKDESFSLNIKTGTFSHKIRCSAFTAKQQIFAHRAHRHLIVNIVTIKNLSSGPVSLNLQTSFRAESEDLDLQQGPEFCNAQYVYGSTLVPEDKSCPLSSVHMIFTPVPPCLVLSSEQEKSWLFLTVVADTELKAKEQYSEGVTLFEEKSLISSHVDAWTRIWEGCWIEVEGDPVLRQAVYGCLYYLLSSLPPLGCSEAFNGVSPGGLSNGQRDEDYWGHVFWDQDTWIYPNILLFSPEMARHILKYRIRTLGGARQNAEQQGYKGAKFPWESAVTGLEVCPEKIYGDEEIHINGDVVMAFKQYYEITKDLDFFASCGGWEVVSSVADYWCSRVVWSEEEQCYHIKGVMPPDEYHSDVDNSVYTNALAQISLSFAIDLATSLQYHVPDEWKEIANKIKIPFDSENNYHPEYDTYTLGEKVKQADAVLLGYPLMFPMTAEQRRNDLLIYEPATDPDGPAMTWSMFAVGFMELKEIDTAEGNLRRCFSNITEPFKIWTECADGSGAVNFLTGMGGFLQAVLFGFTGFRIKKQSLDLDPLLPDEITKLEITGVYYLGNKLNFTFTKNITTVELTATPGKPNVSLVITFGELVPSLPLYIGKPVSFPTKAAHIQPNNSSPFKLNQRSPETPETGCQVVTWAMVASTGTACPRDRHWPFPALVHSEALYKEEHGVPSPLSLCFLALYKEEHGVPFPPFFVFSRFVQQQAKMSAKGFKSKPIKERLAFLRENGICFKCCASTKHIAKDCKMQANCSECGSNRHIADLHPNTLHQPLEVAETLKDEGREQKDESASPVMSNCTEICGDSTNPRSCSKICLATVYPTGNKEKAVKMYVVLDEQSNRSLARSDFVDAFNITSSAVPYTLKTCAGVIITAGRRATDFIIESLDKRVYLSLPTLIECDMIPDDKAEIPSPEVALHHPHLKSIIIPAVQRDTSILLLLGRDILQTDTLGNSVFQKTKDDDKQAMFIDDQAFLHIMDKEAFQDENNNWVAPLPFPISRCYLPSNREQAMKRLNTLRKTLQRKLEVKKDFTEFIKRILDNNQAEVAPPLDTGKEHWYLPMFGVYHPHKPDQRVVFDSSAQHEGASLNDVLLSGPDLSNTLLGVLLCFRKEPIAFTEDVQQMFYCFLVREDHRDYLRFLWYKDNDIDK
ncbi:protein-glucosylgalactosylhydroxylysine glucosidase [Gastrophryne carolinensis]